MPTADRPLIGIVHSGDYERVRFVLAAAAAAAAAERRVTLFFTMDACVALRQTRGWHGLRTTDGTARARDAVLRDRGIAGFEELLEACRELKVQVAVCDMGLRANAIAPDELIPELEVEIVGLVSLLSGAGAAAQLLFA